MTIADFLAKITGQSDRLEAVAGKLESALASNEAKDTQIADLEAKLAAAPTSDNSQEIERLTAELSAATSRADAAEAKQADFDAKVTEAANAEAARIVAANGHEPVPTAGGKKPDESKPDLSGLTGLAKAIAAHKAKKSTLTK